MKNIFLLVTCLFFITSYDVNAQEKQTEIPDEYLDAIKWRNIGPFRGGRSAAVTGVSGKSNLFYMGSTGGGIWKTNDAGNTWKNISDGFFGGSVGAIAVSESDNNVLYVGMGEKTVRGNVSSGDGVWKIGKCWKNLASYWIKELKTHSKNENSS